MGVSVLSGLAGFIAESTNAHSNDPKALTSQSFGDILVRLLEPHILRHPRGRSGWNRDPSEEVQSMDGCVTGSDTQFHEDVLHMATHGLAAHTQTLGHRVIAQVQSQKPGHFQFPTGEGAIPRPRNPTGQVPGEGCIRTGVGSVGRRHSTTDQRNPQRSMTQNFCLFCAAHRDGPRHG